LQANPPVGKDQPPDLAALVPSGTINLPDQPEKQPSSQPTEGNHVSVDEPKIISGKNSSLYPHKHGNNTFFIFLVVTLQPLLFASLSACFSTWMVFA